MKRRRKKAATAQPRARVAGGQRQHLIEACISALHLYGPSRTTVEKVVAIANMSPGIVRFYFDSKAAMLVASLQFLADEFEQEVMAPVTKLKATPVEALRLLVDLYLDPNIASPRKVSVWYAFWGEASSRQEYYDICGQKDESFTNLVRELIGAVIATTSPRQLDPNGVALGLIGALEILWQEIAFQTEHDIDRPAARRRCLAYLNSVVPGYFAAQDAAPDAASRGQLASWMYGDAQLWRRECEQLFRGAWLIVGHESQLRLAGDFLTAFSGGERLLVIRGRAGALHALRNCCPEAPHALTGLQEGQFGDSIRCPRHAREFALDGKSLDGAAGLKVLEWRNVQGFIVVRGHAAGPAADSALPDHWFDAPLPDGLMLLNSPAEIAVAADWKTLMDHWLGTAGAGGASAGATAAAALRWTVPMSAARWSDRNYARIVDCVAAPAWQRVFVVPNQLLEVRPDGVSVMQAVPRDAGRCVVRRLDYSVLAPEAGARAAIYLARRSGAFTRRATLGMAESVQSGMIDLNYGSSAVLPPAVAWFHRALSDRTPSLYTVSPPQSQGRPA